MFKSHFPNKEQIIFFRQFGLLLQGGLALPESLRTISPHLKKHSQSIVDKLIKEVEKGRLLSQGLLIFPRLFSPVVVSLIEVGEASGSLAGSMLAVAEELQQKQNAKKKIIASLTYPVIIVAATGGVIALLMLYVFPKILPVFTSLHAKVPLSTQLLIQADVFVRHQSRFLLIALLPLVVGIWFGLTSRRLKKWRDRCLLTAPFLGRIAKNYFLGHFCRTLGQLLQKQVPVIRAVVITANSTGNLLYRQRIIALSMAVNRGQSLTQFLASETLFPPVLKQLVAVGEKTGTLSDNLLFLADLYDQEINDSLARLTVFLEPLMMIVIGTVVGFVAISIITPIYQITQNIHA